MKIYRIFLIVSPTAITTANFKLKGIAGSTGRLDVIARSIISALVTKSNIRRNVEVWSLLEGPPNPPIIIKVLGREVECMPSNEIEVVKIIRDLLAGRQIAGYYVTKMGFKRVVKELLNTVDKVYYLRENGANLNYRMFNYERLGFILGSHVDLPKEYELFLDENNIERIKLSNVSYLTSQCVTIVNRILDYIEVYASDLASS